MRPRIIYAITLCVVIAFASCDKDDLERELMENPIQTKDSESPEVPEDPEQPGAPEEPGEAGSPDDPDDPEMPNDPDDPNSPIAPETPETPEPERYSLTLMSDNNCSTTATVDNAPCTGEVEAGKMVIINAIPQDRCLFVQWVIIEGGEELIINPTDNPVTFTMPTGNVSIKAEFSEKVKSTNDVLTLITAPSLKNYAEKRMNESADGVDLNGKTVRYPKWDINGDGKLSMEEAARVKYISVSGTGAESLSGIEYFTELQVLFCSNNNLTKIDLSKNTELIRLSCHNNKLTQLDLSKNTKLTLLMCNKNQLSQLDTSKNIELEEIQCHDNKITHFNLTKNAKLRVLYCYNNRIKELDATPMAKDKENSYWLFCGMQITNGTTPQTVSLTLRKNMEFRWNINLYEMPENKGVVIKQ